MTAPAWAIRARHVSKHFGLFTSPRHRLLSALGLAGAQAPPVFRALDDVSLDVPRGATIGIVGRNGSGKSTLLQVICGILQPTQGEIDVEGRISTILDLGGGFNPELTGRENVILRGGILGIGRREMDGRLGDIEAFADVGAFFDRPVKIYSSGMFVRLAFAAAINADPDILLIDEALAVGDARFQHKCFQKIHELRLQGKTIVLVTHNTEAIVRHCDRAYLMEAGGIVDEGSPRDIVNSYLELLFTGRLSAYAPRPMHAAPVDARHVDEPHPAVHEPHRAVDTFMTEAVGSDRCASRSSYNPNERRIGDRRGEIVDYLIVSHTGVDLFNIGPGDALQIHVKARFVEPVDTPMFGLSLKTKDGILVYASNSRYVGLVLDAARRDETIVFTFSVSCMLHPGDYFLDLGLADMRADADLPIDIRYGMAHLVVQSGVQFDGLVNLGAGAREAVRLPPAPSAVGSAS